MRTEQEEQDAVLAEKLGAECLRTLQATVVQLGFPPDHTDQVLRDIIFWRRDPIAIMALGAYLDECRKNGNYDRLIKGLSDIARGQKRKADRQKGASDVAADRQVPSL